ncbi:MAG: hypothetical protein HYX47_01430 [Burkholderiales bacterium]|nr:hypothetical protein [Burkholderiales bacterium]
MIQLANDPNASRPGYRPAQPERKGYGFELKGSRTGGHAWPFPSRYSTLPARQDGEKGASNDSGS